MESASAGIRVAILDDDRLMRESLCPVLEREGIEIVAMMGDPGEFLSSLHVTRPHIAIVDLVLDSGNGGAKPEGLPVLAEIRCFHPEVKTVVVSGCHDQELIKRCIEEGGVSAYLQKMKATPAAVLATIHAVFRGERLVSADLAGVKLAPAAPGWAGHGAGERSVLEKLTQREREVFAYVGSGADNLKIASHLEISERTIKAHVSSLYRKLEAENRAQLALLARQLGIRPPDI